MSYSGKGGYIFDRQDGSRKGAGLTTVRLHKLVMMHLERGHQVTSIAQQLRINKHTVTRLVGMLDGVAPDVIALMKDQYAGILNFSLLAKLKYSRQRQCVQAMLAMNNFSERYLRLLMAGTTLNEFKRDTLPDFIKELRPSTRQKLVRWAETIEPSYRDAVDRSAEEQRALIVAEGFARKVLSNTRISSYLQRRYPNLFRQLSAALEAGERFSTK